ncbi:response regulator transcription factor [Thermocoleostomius sinensis]|uniref:Response regulator transcription factor n=1 Tax=Thermocoleostomius sinensis A174 TaxID=2016057 RepID=A0A9E9C4E3_9CYAN|nr:response regulator transcription factor [Thermocoleostomius sinensis]WAL59956.1 response regulator transcription factor [Thermocoleostomius sinensis A174]
MRILLVEDDDRIAEPLAEDLRYQHYVVDSAKDGLEGWEYTQAASYDLILLDLMLPKLDGVQLCKRLRAEGYQGFVLMLTARDTTTDKVIGLDAGADDYLVKPFKLEELSARIRALARRPVELRQNTLQHEKLELNPASHTVAYDSKPISLTPKEYLILECLIQNPTQVFTRSMLLDKLWELDQVSGSGTIKTHITNIRRKLKTAGSQRELIETVYGVGYRMAVVDE